MPLLTAVARRAVPALALGLAAGLLTSAATGVAHGQSCLCGTLADEFRAADAGLVREWIVQVPFDSGGWRLERVVVGDGLVLAQSGDGAVHAVRASRSRPLIAFPGVENLPDFVVLLRVRWRERETAGDGAVPPGKGDDQDAPPLEIRVPDEFTLRHPQDSQGSTATRSIAALTLLAVPQHIYEKLDKEKQQALGPSSPDTLSAAIDATEINSGRLHVARYAVSIRDGELVVIPGHTQIGTRAWSRTIAAAAGQSWPPTVGARLVLVSSELAVHAIDRDTGAAEWVRSTDSLTAGAAVQSGDWVYQPLRTNRMLRLPVDPLGSPTAEEPAAPEPAAGSRSQAAGNPRAPESLEPLSIDAGGSFQEAPLPMGQNDLLWSTENGFVVLKRTDLGWIRRQLPESNPPTWVRQAMLSLAGPAAVRGGIVFSASRGGNVAAILLQSRKVTDDRGAPAGENGEDLVMRVVWNVTFPHTITSGPLVSGDVVLVSLGPSGLAALSTVDGRQLWKSDLVGTVVAAAGGRVWLLDEVGRLTALDLATGSRRQSCCVGCFTVPVVNTFSERLILASPGGLLVSLAPPRDPEAARPVTADAPEPEAPAPADPDATPP